MNENFINIAKESIKKEKNKRDKIIQLKSEISSEISEHKKLVEGMKKTSLSEEDLSAMSEFKESFEKSLNKKCQEIISLLEKEVDMIKADLAGTEKNLLNSNNSELTSTFKEQINYLKDELSNIHKEIEKYQNIILEYLR